MTVTQGRFMGIDWPAVDRHVHERDEALALAIKISGAPGGKAFYLPGGGVRIVLDPVPPPLHFSAQEYVAALSYGERDGL